MLATIINNNIKFEHNDDDPDVLLKICVTLMIAGANEVHNGVASLWKQGPSYGFRDYPNFAQYVPKNYFKAFVHAFPSVWADPSVLVSVTERPPLGCVPTIRE